MTEIDILIILGATLSAIAAAYSLYKVFLSRSSDNKGPPDTRRSANNPGATYIGRQEKMLARSFRNRLNEITFLWKKCQNILLKSYRMEAPKELKKKLDQFNESMSKRVVSSDVDKICGYLLNHAQPIGIPLDGIEYLKKAQRMWSCISGDSRGLALIQANHTLKFGPHFRKELEQYRQNLRRSLGEHAYGANLVNYCRVLYCWGKYAKSWLDLQKETAKGITKVEEGTSQLYGRKMAVIRNTYGWLRHPALENSFDLPNGKGGKSTFAWSPWCILSYPDRFEQACMLIEKEIHDKGWEFKAVCALSSSGFPLAIFISRQFDSPVIGLDEKAREFFPKPPAGIGNILLVDFSIHTGNTLARAIADLERLGERYEGAVTVCYNDHLDNAQPEKIVQLFDQRAIVFLFKISDFDV